MNSLFKKLCIATLPFYFSGCTVIAVADAVGSAAVSVVSTAASVTGSVVGGAYDLATGSDDEDKDSEKKDD